MDHLFNKIDRATHKVFGTISRRAGKAIVDYGMIRSGDKIIIGISGGKDSMTLLNVMLHRQKIAPVDFEITAVHVDSGLPGPRVDKLEEYFKECGVLYQIVRTDTFRNKDLSGLNCFWCSWNRRKALFDFAKRSDFTKIALGHHLDDIAESIVMSQFFKGEVSAMLPKQDLFKGKVSIIRPLCYERERTVIDFAKAAGLTAFESCRCPVSETGQRAAVKKILRDVEKVCPGVVPNIFNSLKNIKEEYLP